MVLIGVDDMDLFKGIELKLLAVERVLDYHPEWRGRLVLVQVTNAPRCLFSPTIFSPHLKPMISWKPSFRHAWRSVILYHLRVPLALEHLSKPCGHQILRVVS